MNNAWFVFFIVMLGISVATTVYLLFRLASREVELQEARSHITHLVRERSDKARDDAIETLQEFVQRHKDKA